MEHYEHDPIDATQTTLQQHSPKRNKKIKTEREAATHTHTQRETAPQIQTQTTRTEPDKHEPPTPSMQQIYKIANINISGIASTTRKEILGDILWRQDTDIALLQEVTHASFESIRGYTALLNEQTNATQPYWQMRILPLTVSKDYRLDGA
jgi:hypothetical protein